MSGIADNKEELLAKLRKQEKEFFEEQKYEEAISCFQQILSINPRDIEMPVEVLLEALKGLSYAYSGLKNYEKAIECYKEAITIDPHDPQYAREIFKIGDIYFAEDYERAIQVYKTYCSIVDRDKCGPALEKICKIGDIFAENQNYVQALKIYQEVLAIAPEYEDAHSKIGDSYFESGNLEKAAQVYARFLDIGGNYNNDLMSKFLAIGDVYFDRGEYLQAREIYERILTNEEKNILPPKEYSVYYKHALDKTAKLYVELKDYRATLNTYKKILEKFPEPNEIDRIFKRIQTILVKEDGEKKLLVVETQKKMLSFLTHTLRNTIAGGPRTVKQVLEIAQEVFGSRYREPDIYNMITDLAGLHTIFTLIHSMLDTYRLYVSEPADIMRKWNADRSGTVTVNYLFALVCKQAIEQIIFEETHLSQFKSLVTMQNQYSIKEICGSFLKHVSIPELTTHNEKQVFLWLETYFPVIALKIEDTGVVFNPQGIRFSILFACISEIVYNALKYTASTSPIQAVWKRQERAFVFLCQNAFTPASTEKAGDRKGLDFINGLTELVDGLKFERETENEIFTARLSIQDALLKE